MEKFRKDGGRVWQQFARDKVGDIQLAKTYSDIEYPGAGVGEHEHGLGLQVPGSPAGPPLRRPHGDRGGAGEAAAEDAGVPGGVRHQGEHGVRPQAQGGHLPQEEEERRPEAARVQLRPHRRHQREEEQSDAVHQGDQRQMIPQYPQ